MLHKTAVLPDPELGLRDSRDFILNSNLGRSALSSDTPLLTVLISDLVDAIYRLVQSCHMPEFTDHGLPHLCSLIDRISTWQCPPESRQTLVDQLTPNESARLLLATLLHDIGMLSQSPVDLPPNANPNKSKAAAPDIATWVRQTHVDRLKGLATRVLKDTHASKLLTSSLFADSVAIAESHQAWPWEWQVPVLDANRNRALAAVLAISDLLDEDSARCDTFTLIEHREGNEINRAHWMRHALTTGRILVQRGEITVNMVRPPGSDPQALKSVYSALRNHFRLVNFYENDLKKINAPITNINFNPGTGVPKEESADFPGWKSISGFANNSALAFQLLRTFMPIALLDEQRMGNDGAQAARDASLELVDLCQLTRFRSSEEPVSDIEETFAAVVRG